MRRPFAPLRERRSHSLELGAETIEVRVRESSRARVARIVVGPGRPVEIVVPRRVSAAEIDRILQGRRHWISAQTLRMRSLETDGRLGLSQPGLVPLAGGHIPVLRGSGSRSLARLQGGSLIVAGPLDEAEDSIERWYRREARARLEAASDREAARLGVRFSAISVRDQRTRWGSCSAGGRLSFNWRLVLAPPVVLEYVVIHELCHLRQANHSSRFWRLVDEAMPGHKAHARWLKEHAFELQSYRPELRA